MDKKQYTVTTSFKRYFGYAGMSIALLLFGLNVPYLVSMVFNVDFGGQAVIPILAVVVTGLLLSVYALGLGYKLRQSENKPILFYILFVINHVQLIFVLMFILGDILFPH